MLQVRILAAQDHDPTFWSSSVFVCQNPPHFHDSSFRNMACCCSTCLVSNPALHFYSLCLFELPHLLIGQIFYSHFASMLDLVYCPLGWIFLHLPHFLWRFWLIQFKNACSIVRTWILWLRLHLILRFRMQQFSHCLVHDCVRLHNALILCRGTKRLLIQLTPSMACPARSQFPGVRRCWPMRG